MKMMMTQKQDGFTLDLFKGLRAVEAYKNNYNTVNMGLNAINVEACRLAQNPKIALKLEELRREARLDDVADYQERQRILTQIARGNITDYLTCGPDRDSICVGPESPNTKALQEVTSKTDYDKDGSGVAVVTKIKLHNPVTAIDLLNKMDGIYSDIAPTQTQVINSFTFILPNGTRVTPKQLKGADEQADT